MRLGHLHLESRRRAEGRAEPGACAVIAVTTAGCAWPRMQRAPRADVVDVLAAVVVPDARAARRAR